MTENKLIYPEQYSVLTIDTSLSIFGPAEDYWPMLLLLAPYNKGTCTNPLYL